MNTITFSKELVQRLPELKPIYDEHLIDNEGELLPHVFMADVARFVIAEAYKPRSRQAITSLLEYLEQGLRTGSQEVEEVILASFMEQLTGEETAIRALKPLMGPNLRLAVARLNW